MSSSKSTVASVWRVAQMLLASVLFTACMLTMSFDEYDDVDRKGGRRFAVSGVVSGLNGESVIVNVNGEELVRYDGPFTFSAAVPEGVAYSVTVHSVPRDHRCEVRNGVG